MNRQSTKQHPDRRRIDGARLRQHVAEVATAIPCTEDQIAETLERMSPGTAGRRGILLVLSAALVPGGFLLTPDPGEGFALAPGVRYG